MKQRKYKFACLNINRFNPFLCDGVSALHLWSYSNFSQKQGHEAVILAYSTHESFKQSIFFQAVQQHAPELQGKNLKSFSYMLDNIAVDAELLPFGSNRAV